MGLFARGAAHSSTVYGGLFCSEVDVADRVGRLFVVGGLADSSALPELQLVID